MQQADREIASNYEREVRDLPSSNTSLLRSRSCTGALAGLRRQGGKGAVAAFDGAIQQVLRGCGGASLPSTKSRPDGRLTKRSADLLMVADSEAFGPESMRNSEIFLTSATASATPCLMREIERAVHPSPQPEDPFSLTSEYLRFRNNRAERNGPC